MFAALVTTVLAVFARRSAPSVAASKRRPAYFRPTVDGLEARIVPAELAAGLTAKYYNDTTHFSNNPSITLTNKNVDYTFINQDGSYNDGLPFPIDARNAAKGQKHKPFSVIWTGEITPEKTGKYTFYTEADDGARLYDNDEKLIDDFDPKGHPPKLVQADKALELEAGKHYALVMDYYEDEDGGAVAKLEWSNPEVEKLKTATVIDPVFFSHYKENGLTIAPQTVGDWIKASEAVAGDDREKQADVKERIKEVEKLFKVDLSKDATRDQLFLHRVGEAKLRGKDVVALSLFDNVQFRTEDPSVSIIQAVTIRTTTTPANGGKDVVEEGSFVEGFVPGKDGKARGLDNHIVSAAIKLDGSEKKVVKEFTLTVGTGLYEGQPITGTRGQKEEGQRLASKPGYYDGFPTGKEEDVQWYGTPKTYKITLTLTLTGQATGTYTFEDTSDKRVVGKGNF